MIRVFVVDEILLICHALTVALQKEPEIEVIGSTIDLDEVISFPKSYDLVLVSDTLPDQGAFRLTQALAKTKPQVKVVVTGVPDSEQTILRYIEVGVAAYVLRDEPVEELVKNIKAAYNSEAIVSKHIAAVLMSRIAQLVELCGEGIEKIFNFSNNLTPREHEVLQLIQQKMSNKEIANVLGIEVGTVKNHVHNILKKLNVSSRRAAVVYADKLVNTVQNNY
jgi:DNA-binding NarL/FixJ family response regulator